MSAISVRVYYLGKPMPTLKVADSMDSRRDNPIDRILIADYFTSFFRVSDVENMATRYWGISEDVTVFSKKYSGDLKENLNYAPIAIAFCRIESNRELPNDMARLINQFCYKGLSYMDFFGDGAKYVEASSHNDVKDNTLYILENDKYHPFREEYYRENLNKNQRSLNLSVCFMGLCFHVVILFIFSIVAMGKHRRYTHKLIEVVKSLFISSVVMICLIVLFWMLNYNNRRIRSIIVGMVILSITCGIINLFVGIHIIQQIQKKKIKTKIGLKYLWILQFVVFLVIWVTHIIVLIKNFNYNNLL